MKTVFMALCILALFLSNPAYARVKTAGNGDSLNFDVETIPPDLRQTFNTMNKKCTQCHSMEMVVTAVLTGVCPETKQPFDRQTVKAYGIRMIHKKNADISKKEMRDIVVLLNRLLDEQAKK